jgi:hypothetical protein
MDELCDFLKIPPVTLESPNPVTTAHVDQNSARLVKKYSDLNAPINPHAISRWKELLDLQTIEAIEDICKTEMDFFGYAHETRVQVPIPGKFRFLARWYEIKEKLIFHFPLSLKLKRLE